MQALNQYLQIVKTRLQSGISREHSYRGDFENLFRQIVTDVNITNEPANVTDCGNPDFVLTKKNKTPIPIGYIEAKDLGKDLNSKSYKEQFSRYKKALDNLIITDYLWFQFFQNGELVHEIRIAEIIDHQLKPIPENFSQFENLLQNFCTFTGQTIKSAKKLAEMMAAKARLFQDILENAITSDEATQENTTIQQQYRTFKQVLIHDLSPKAFADIYAQTLAYGMFAARSQDETIEDFSRQEAAELVPKSNPFLRKLFSYIAGVDIDERIKTPVDNLAEVFRAANVNDLLSNYGKSTQTQDPIIHFYETFLAEYDPKLRKARGVWYTPEPVVNFIVRAVDDILKTEFGLSQGLADTSKTTIKVKQATHDKRVKGGQTTIDKEVHKVQILDPATGTGTFLAAVIRHIYNNRFKAMQGAWSGYVENDLIPRLNGFELLMASYAMAHLKMDLLLKETGYTNRTSNKRFNIFLTNSLEEHHQDTGTLFSSWLSEEANQANRVKRDTPVMCIIGNPPYSGESANKGEWIMNLMQDYKKEPGGKEKLKEQNSKFINDDYVKFIRYAQHFIEKNGTGVLAFINPHGYLDNPTFRGMRWHLLKTFDKIYTIDLHGNAKKKEVCPDGTPDVNVFDIEQGVSINFFVKTGKKKTNQLGEVLHYDLFGKRELKYDFLNGNFLNTINFKKISPFKNSYLYKDIDEKLYNQYQTGMNPVKLFQINVMGFQTHRDDFCIDTCKKNLTERLLEFANNELSEQEISNTFGIKSSTDFNIQKAQIELRRRNINDDIVKCGYRPFDNRYIFFDRIIVDRPRKELIAHSKNKNNLHLGIGRQGLAVGNIEWCLTTVSKHPVDANMFRRGGVNLFPLYLYPKSDGQQTTEQNTDRKPNLNQEIVNKIAVNLDLRFTNEKEILDNTFAPIDILDYIYAVLHSRNYREKYKEFLKIDFPRVPYPKDATTFWQLVALGKQIRAFHLLESPQTENYVTSYPKDGDNIVTRKLTKTSIGFELNHPTEKEITPTSKVWINDNQYFDGVPEIAWHFYIGGYQPAQKWLKDRKGRTLSYDDILHYQKIIVALTQTHRLMQAIDKIEIE